MGWSIWVVSTERDTETSQTVLEGPPPTLLLQTRRVDPPRAEDIQSTREIPLIPGAGRLGPCVCPDDPRQKGQDWVHVGRHLVLTPTHRHVTRNVGHHPLEWVSVTNGEGRGCLRHVTRLTPPPARELRLRLASGRRVVSHEQTRLLGTVVASPGRRGPQVGVSGAGGRSVRRRTETDVSPAGEAREVRGTRSGERTVHTCAP